MLNLTRAEVALRDSYITRTHDFSVNAFEDALQTSKGGLCLHRDAVQQINKSANQNRRHVKEIRHHIDFLFSSMVTNIVDGQIAKTEKDQILCRRIFGRYSSRVHESISDIEFEITCLINRWMQVLIRNDTAYQEGQTILLCIEQPLRAPPLKLPPSYLRTNNAGNLKLPKF